MSMHEVREDHGEFRIQIENEQALIAQAVQVASTNPNALDVIGLASRLR